MGDPYGWRRPGFIPGLVIIACLGILTAYAWVRIPTDATVVVQVDFGGAPNNTESKGFALLTLPVVLIVLAPLLDVVPFIPQGKRSTLYRGEYNLLVWYVVLAVASIVQVIIVVKALQSV